MKNIFYRLAAGALFATFFFAYAINVEAKSHHRNWAEDKLEDVHEDYEKAIKKIGKSSFSEEQKKILKAQADANRDLVTSQIKALSAQLTKNQKERESFKEAIKSSRENRKAVREVDDIL